MWSDASTAAAWATAITTPVVVVLTFIATKGVDGWIKYRQQRHIEHGADADREEKGFLFVISEVTKARDEALKRLDNVSQQLLAAVQEREFLKGQDREKSLRIAMLEKESQEQHDTIKELRARLHNVANSVQKIELKQAVAEREAEIKKENGT